MITKGVIPIYFYDTCSLLRLQEEAFKEPFYISSVTLEELEAIKTSGSKDEETKAQARAVVRLLNEHEGEYQVVMSVASDEEQIKAMDLPITPDNRILVCAQNICHEYSTQFVTDDLLLRLKAQAIGLPVAQIEDNQSTYQGWTNFDLGDEEFSSLYSDMSVNRLNLMINEYAILKRDGDIVDTVKWDGQVYKRVPCKTLKTKTLDNIKPKDAYQQCAVDSILNNTMTILHGKAGSGKTLIGLATAMYLIEQGKYDRLVIMFNPVKARGAADLGFYKGSRIEKAMSNSIGEILISKFGDRYIVDNLIGQEKIRLLSMADARGCQVQDNEILYITECQNASIDLLKLCLSRCSQGCKIILDGDFDAQVDSWQFEGRKNGLRRAVDALKGNELVGIVELPNVWRSKIAELVQRM